MKRENLEKVVRKRLELWGYKEVRIPVLSENIWRKDDLLFFEKNGKILALRPEITSEIIKNINADSLPNRLFYMGPVFSIVDGDVEEKFQIGWELIYKPEVWRDLEVLLIIKEIMEEIKLQDFILEIGNTRIWNSIWNIIDDDNKVKLLKDLLIKRDYVSFFENTKEYNKNIMNVIKELIFFDDVRVINDPLVKEEIEFLIDFKNKLIMLGFPEDNIVVNPALYRPFGYYDGIVFEVYLEGVKTSFGGGGSYIEKNKYGNLLYGFGFAFLEENLIEIFHEPTSKEKVKYYFASGDDFVKVYEEMKRERDKGIISIFIPKEFEKTMF